MGNQRINKSRISRFAIVGVFNTIFDFGVLNFLVFAFGLSNIYANIVSSTMAVVLSFFLNHSFVFKEDGKRTLQKFMMFVAITMVGLYGLQNILIYLFTVQLTAPAGWAFDLLNWLTPGTFSKDFVSLNIAKAFATLASLTWNYFMYAKFVFKKYQEQP